MKIFIIFLFVLILLLNCAHIYGYLIPRTSEYILDEVLNQRRRLALNPTEFMHYKKNYLKLKKSSSTLKHKVVFEIKNKNLDQLEKYVHEMSDPDHPRYGKIMKYHEVKQLTSNPEAVIKVKDYLKRIGANILSNSSPLSPQNDENFQDNKEENNHIRILTEIPEDNMIDYIEAEAPISVWEHVFKASFHEYQYIKEKDDPEANGKKPHLDVIVPSSVHRSLSIVIPQELEDSVTTVYNTIQYPAVVHADHVIPEEEYFVPENVVPLDSVNATDTEVIVDESLLFHETLNHYQGEFNVNRRLQAKGYVTPSFLRTVYNMGANTRGSAQASQGVYGTKESALSLSDLTKFFKINGQSTTVGNETRTVNNVNGIANTIEAGCNFAQCVEPNLDTQFLMGVSRDSTTSFVQWKGDDPWLEWITSLANTPTTLEIGNSGKTSSTNAVSKTGVPLVISFSYGSDESNISTSYYQSFNVQALKLSAQGVTFVASSGNSGANKSNKCGYTTQFPASSPYVTAVGGSMGPEVGAEEVVCQSNRDGVITSGGGFSIHNKVLDFQKAAIDKYFDTVETKPASGYRVGGRGYPDLSALSRNYELILDNKKTYVSGTSAAAPVVAGMISMVNALRLSQNMSPVGWINPTLYKYANDFVNDIIDGSNKCRNGKLCCKEGFFASKGWDPVSGLGSLNFEKFKNKLLSLSSSPLDVPTAYPTLSPNQITRAPTMSTTTIPTVNVLPNRLTWLTEASYEEDDCTGEIVKFKIIPANVCIPVVQYKNNVIRIMRYQKVSCGINNAQINYYSDNKCMNLITKTSSRFDPTLSTTTMPAPTTTDVTNYIINFECNALSTSYYYSNSPQDYSNAFSCMTTSSTDIYGSTLVPASEPKKNYYILGDFSDPTCNTVGSLVYYIKDYCYNINDFSTFKSYIITSSSPSNFMKFTDTKCYNQTGSYSYSSKSINENQCGYGSNLLSGNYTTNFYENWTSFTK